MKQESVDYILKEQRELKKSLEDSGRYTEVQMCYMPIVLAYDKEELILQYQTPTIFHIENDGTEEENAPIKSKKQETKKTELREVKEDKINVDGQLRMF